MAKLKVLPSQGIIDGFKGTVDFYVYMGLPVARTWPRRPNGERSPAVKAQWLPFAYAAKEWLNVSAFVQAAYERLATNSGLTGRDMQVRAYLTGLYRYPIP